MRRQRVLERILSGKADKGIRFRDLVAVLESLGFRGRTKGDHFIFSRDGVAEIVNLQPLPDGMCKPYQVKQVRGIITKYGLGQSE